MNSTTEIWKDIPSYEGVYQISNKGRLKSFKRYKNGKILSNINKKGWYFNVVLRYGNQKRSVKIHVLVAEMFLGLKPFGCNIHHKDGNKQNNSSDNLEYLKYSEHSRLTAKENPKLIYGMVYYNKNIRPTSILQFDLNGNFINEFPNCAQASKETGICRRNILMVANKSEYKPGKIRKQAGGFIWKLKLDSHVA
jgi:hypothetical protein